jgi:hypothetical protein
MCVVVFSPFADLEETLLFQFVDERERGRKEMNRKR